MYFPWLGQLNQAYLADAFVFYSDVQFARGFINRVQLLINGRQELITVPTLGSKRSLINKLSLDGNQDWQSRHRRKLHESFENSEHSSVALKIFNQVLACQHSNLASLSAESVKVLCQEIFPKNCPAFFDSSDFDRDVSGTAALIHICKELSATSYLTGHGAKNYIDHTLFEDENIKLEFIDYHISPYPQYLNQFVTPYVSSLDAIARVGSAEAAKLLQSTPLSGRLPDSLAKFE